MCSKKIRWQLSEAAALLSGKLRLVPARPNVSCTRYVSFPQDRITRIKRNSRVSAETRDYLLPAVTARWIMHDKVHSRRRAKILENTEKTSRRNCCYSQASGFLTIRVYSQSQFLSEKLPAIFRVVSLERHAEEYSTAEKSNDSIRLPWFK